MVSEARGRSDVELDGGGVSVCKSMPHEMGWGKFGRGPWRPTVGKALWGEKAGDVLLTGPDGKPGADADKLDVMLVLRLKKAWRDDKERTVPGRPQVLILPRDEAVLVKKDGHFWLPKDAIIKAYRIVDDKQFEKSFNARTDSLAFKARARGTRDRRARRATPLSAPLFASFRVDSLG